MKNPATTFATLFAIFGWLSVVASLIAQGITYRVFHEDRANHPRRALRTYIIGAGVLSAVMTGISLLRSGGIQQSLSVVEQTVAAQKLTIADLKRQLGEAQGELATERRSVKTQSRQITAQQKAINRQQTSLLDIGNEITETQAQVGKTTALASSVAVTSAAAALAAKKAHDEAQSIATTVHDADVTLTQQLEVAQNLARAAATKAGVYRLPRNARAVLVASLKAAVHGSAQIACAPGLETACDDLGAAFTEAGWNVRVYKGVSFFTGGGLDAQPNENPASGLVVWYGKPSDREIAMKITAVMVDAGLTSDARPSFADYNADIGISFLFAAH